MCVSHSVVSNSLDCNPPCSSVHEIFQAGILEWVAISFSRGSSWSRDWTWVSCISGRLFTIWATREICIIYIQQNAPILDKGIHKCYHHPNQHLGRFHHSGKLHNPFFSHSLRFSSVQSLSCVQLFSTPWTEAHQASLSITNSWSLPKLMSIELVMPSNHLILCCPLLLLPSIFSSIRVFSNESDLRIRWPKYWSFSFNISPSNEHPELISSRMDLLDLLAAQGTLKSLLQHHSSKASILRHSAFFTVQLSHPNMTTGKTIALTGRTFVDKVVSLLFNMLSRLVITFLPRSKRLLISWLQPPSAVILEPPKIKSATVSTVSPPGNHFYFSPQVYVFIYSWL